MKKDLLCFLNRIKIGQWSFKVQSCLKVAQPFECNAIGSVVCENIRKVDIKIERIRQVKGIAKKYIHRIYLLLNNIKGVFYYVYKMQ